MTNKINISSLLLEFSRRFDRMQTKTLQRLLKELEGLNSSNCWWFAYQIKEPLSEIIKNKLALRKELKITALTGGSK